MSIKILTAHVNNHFYNSFFIHNPYIWPHNLTGINNKGSNRGLPEIYNSFINDNLANDCWLFFLHEDFEIKSSLDHILKLPKNSVYGTFGVRLENGIPIAYGTHRCSNKDGSRAVSAGKNVHSTINVDALDCQSILIHTSLLRKYKSLRFDESLKYDLYAEDLCMQAKLLELSVQVINLQFQHYSHGNIQPRYHECLKYLSEKYPDHAIPGTCSFIGGQAHTLEKNFKYDIIAMNQ